jgi:hypothetical protein
MLEFNSTISVVSPSIRGGMGATSFEIL